jgi:hypothetical protein
MPPEGLRWNAYAGLIDLARVRLGELPDGCREVMWLAHGIEYKTTRQVRGPITQRFPQLLDDVVRFVKGRAWAEARQFGISPTGEVDPHALFAVDAGLLREVGAGLGRRRHGVANRFGAVSGLRRFR